MDISKFRSDSPDKISDGKLRGTSAANKTNKNASIGETKSSTPSATEQVHSERVRLSQDARGLQEGVEAAKQTPEERAEKVAALKEQNKNGTYKTDSKAIAEKMIRSSIEEDLLTRME
mgnify:CR=1 FL=1